MGQHQQAELHHTRTKLKGEQVQLQNAVSTLKESLESVRCVCGAALLGSAAQFTVPAASARTLLTLAASPIQANIETAEAEKRRLTEMQKRQQMSDSMKAMQKEVKEIKGVLVERDNQLADSHRKIRDLERSRRVLQQQLQDLRAALVPHDREIAMLKDQIKELDEECVVVRWSCGRCVFAWCGMRADHSTRRVAPPCLACQV